MIRVREVRRGAGAGSTLDSIPRQPRPEPRSAAAAVPRQVSEGYGPGDAAVLVDCLTDEPRGTAAAVRSAFFRHGGLPAAPGAVRYLFQEVGRLVFPADARSESLVRLAWEAGAEDVLIGRDGAVEVRTDPIELEAVRSRLERAGFTAAVSAVTQRAATTVSLEGSAADQMKELIAALRRIDGVRRIYTNAEVAGEILESI